MHFVRRQWWLLLLCVRFKIFAKCLHSIEFCVLSQILKILTTSEREKMKVRKVKIIEQAQLRAIYEIEWTLIWLLTAIGIVFLFIYISSFQWPSENIVAILAKIILCCSPHRANYFAKFDVENCFHHHHYLGWYTTTTRTYYR